MGWQQQAAPHLRNHFSGVPQLAAPQRAPQQLTSAPQYAAAPQLTNTPHTRPTHAAPTGLPHARTSQAPAASQYAQYSSAPPYGQPATRDSLDVQALRLRENCQILSV